MKWVLLWILVYTINKLICEAIGKWLSKRNTKKELYKEK